MGGGYADAVSTGSGSIWLAVAALDLPKGSEGHRLADHRPGFARRDHDERSQSRASPMPSPATTTWVQRSSPHASGRMFPGHGGARSGQATDIDKIVEIAHAKGLKVIEDCSSQSHGAPRQWPPDRHFRRRRRVSTMYPQDPYDGRFRRRGLYARPETFRNALAHADRGKPRWEKDFDDRNPET